VFKLLKGCHCYIPQDIGIKDILIVCGKIFKIDENIPSDVFYDIEVIDCQQCIVCPGFIDQHVHILGGGGEEGPVSRIPEISLTDLTTAGVTTAVGVLGVDSMTRSIGELLAKARALQIEGVNTFIYTGSYNIPTATLTGMVVKDLAFIEKVIGVGEIAISDHRSSHPSVEMFRSIVSETRIGGLIGGKAGIVHIHVGDGKEGLKPLLDLLDQSDFPIDMFIPTHVNRNKALLEQGINHVGNGGFIDLTAGEKTGKGYSVSDAMEKILQSGIDIDRVTISSDGNGSIPAGENSSIGVGKVSQLFDDIKSCIFDRKMDIEKVIKTVSTNVARVLKIFPQKGTLSDGSDADILVLNKNDFSINKVFINGDTFIDNGKIIKKGRYEK
jgi:beta-aspartyl-dipeptidase (metallo-type)